MYLPILSVLETKKIDEGSKEYYLDMSHRYLYYLRYVGELKLIDFEKNINRGEARITTL